MGFNISTYKVCKKFENLVDSASSMIPNIKPSLCFPSKQLKIPNY